MVKSTGKIVFTSILGVGLTVSVAAALPTSGVLQNDLNIRTQGGTSSVDVTTDFIGDASDSAWNITASNASGATLLFERAGFADTTSFGIYDLTNTDKRHEIFAGSGVGGDQATLYLRGDGGFSNVGVGAGQSFFGSGSTFGYYLDVGSTGNTWFSDSSLNTDDNYDHMYAYQGQGDSFSVFNNGNYSTWTANEYVLAWEDLEKGVGDSLTDFTDFVVMVESVEPIPEPTTMLLFGTGIAGLAAVTRRRKK